MDAVPDPGGLETTAELTVASSVGPYLTGPQASIWTLWDAGSLQELRLVEYQFNVN